MFLFAKIKTIPHFKKNVPSPLFRKSVTVDAIPEHCRIAIGTTGFYDLFINGKKKNGKIHLKVTYPETVSCEIIAEGDEEVDL